MPCENGLPISSSEQGVGKCRWGGVSAAAIELFGAAKQPVL